MDTQTTEIAYLERLLELLEKAQSANLRKDREEEGALYQQIERHIGSLEKFLDTLIRYVDRYGYCNNHTRQAIERASTALRENGGPGIYPALWLDFAHESFLSALKYWIKEASKQNKEAEQPTAAKKRQQQKERESNPVKDRFTFSPGQVRFDNKDLHLPTGLAIDVLRKLVENFGETVGYRDLDDNSEAKNASEQLRDAKRKIKKALKANKTPCKIETKKGEGYIISPQTTHK